MLGISVLGLQPICHSRMHHNRRALHRPYRLHGVLGKKVDALHRHLQLQLAIHQQRRHQLFKCGG